jgi:hypothetical protein
MASGPNARRQLVAALNSDLTSVEGREAFWRILAFAFLASSGIDLNAAPPTVRQVFDGTRQPDGPFATWVIGAATAAGTHAAAVQAASESVSSWLRDPDPFSGRVVRFSGTMPPAEAVREQLLRSVAAMPAEILGPYVQAVQKVQRRPAEVPARQARPRAEPVGPGPDPDSAASVAEFMDQVRALRAWSGRSLRVLEATAKDRKVWLPRSSLADALKRTDELLPLDMLRALLIACELSPKEAARWEAAYLRVSRPPAPAQAEAEPVVTAAAAPVRRLVRPKKLRKRIGAAG